jgi:Divergent InlB B-repeat domain
VVTYNTMTFTITTQAVNGTISLSPSGGNYLSVSSVTVTATPDAGYQFIGWSGALTGEETSSTLVMDGNKIR